MQSIGVNQTPNSFSQTINTQKKNTYDIETASIRDAYNNPDLSHYDKSSNNIILFDNLLLNKYYQKIFNSCVKRTFTKEENIKYQYRPEMLSTDEYGTSGLWYIILKVNSCEDFSEFHDFDYVLLPDLNVITQCLTYEEYILKKDIK